MVPNFGKEDIRCHMPGVRSALEAKVTVHTRRTFLDKEIKSFDGQHTFVLFSISRGADSI